MIDYLVMGEKHGKNSIRLRSDIRQHGPAGSGFQRGDGAKSDAWKESVQGRHEFSNMLSALHGLGRPRAEPPTRMFKPLPEFGLPVTPAIEGALKGSKLR